MIWKVSPFVKREILGVHVNTLTADHKYPVWDIENLAFPIKAILSKNRKTLSWVFWSNLKHLQEKEGRHS